MTSTSYIASIVLDDASLSPPAPALEHERLVAINDLTRWNYFLVQDLPGPYDVTLKTQDNRIMLNLHSSTGDTPCVLSIPFLPLRGLLKDYFLICESYFEALKTGNLPRIEAIDMSRRGLHNEGAERLIQLLEEKAVTDTETARRLFTLISVLRMRL